MRKPELLSKQARSAALWMDEMSRLHYLSRAIYAAAELGIADCLNDIPIAIDAVATKTKTHPVFLKRLLQFLSAYGIFNLSTSNRVSHTELSSVLRGDHPNSVRSNIIRIGDFWWSAVGHMAYSIRTGESAFTHLHGVTFFQYLKAHPEIQKRFDDAMARIADSYDEAIAAAYDFSHFRRIVDVGGGQGGLLVHILRQSRKATGVLFEQPQVVERATRLSAAGFGKRAEMIGGDFFKSVPADGDCYVIKNVLHDFNDEDCVKILSNCRAAMKSNGRIVIANQDLPFPIDGPHPNLTMDVQMMVLLRGRERTRAEWSALFGLSGLTPGITAQTGVDYVLIEGKPD